MLKQFEAFLQSRFNSCLIQEPEQQCLHCLCHPLKRQQLCQLWVEVGQRQMLRWTHSYWSKLLWAKGGRETKHNLQPAATSLIQKTWKQVGGNLTDGNIITGLTVKRSTLSHSRCLFVFQPLSDLTDVERLVAEVSPKRKKTKTKTKRNLYGSMCKHRLKWCIRKAGKLKSTHMSMRA